LPFWGGVVPVRTVFGEPEADGAGTGDGVAVPSPEYLRRR
jgi:hypothetical protein